MTILKAYRLEKTLVDKLVKLSKETHRTEKFFVQEALERYLEEYADAQIAKDRFNDHKAKIISSKDMRGRLGL